MLHRINFSKKKALKLGKICLVLTVFIIHSIYCHSQEYTIYGYIKDSATYENLQGVNVICNNKKDYCVSNKYGFYSITLKGGNYKIQCSYIGYKTVDINLNLIENKENNILLTKSLSEIDEVIVVSDKNNMARNSKVGYNSISSLQIKTIPTVAGEADIMKSIQLLPGIQVANEGSSNFNVRGGSYDQNLILLDEAPVYNPSHALGFISTFNPEAIKSVDIYKGVFPVQFGGRLSSVVDISMNEGNKQKLSVTGNIGTVLSGICIEGPLIKAKSSFLLSARYSYVGTVLNLLSFAGENKYVSDLRSLSNRNDIKFYDINFKYNLEINNYNNIFFSFFNGSDKFYSYSLDNIADLNWGNTTATLRWNHIYNSKLFSNFTILYSDYTYSYILKDDIRNYRWLADMNEFDVKADFEYFISSFVKCKIGFFANHHFFSPGRIEPRDSSSVTKAFALDNKNSVDMGLYLNLSNKIANKFLVDYGVRYSNMVNLGPGYVYTYNSGMTEIIDSFYYSRNKIINKYSSIEPRIILRYLLSQNSSIKAAYGYTTQYLHLLSNSSVGLPTDIWIPPDKYIKPQHANQFSVGYFSNIFHDKVSLSIETYYKKMYDVIDYIDNANLFLNPHIETQVKAGSGNSYGIEFMMEKTNGKFTGWIGYTFSKTTLSIIGINNNNPYPARYDIRHNLSIVGNYALSRSWSFSSVFRLTSGGFITIPQGTFYYQGVLFNYYSERNGYELPLYHRLDVAVNYDSPKNLSRKWKSRWSFSIYNIYAHKNVFSLFIRQDPNNLGIEKAYKMYLFSFVPSISYNFKI